MKDSKSFRNIGFISILFSFSLGLVYPPSIAQDSSFSFIRILSEEESLFKPLIQRDIEALIDELIEAFNLENSEEDFNVSCLRETRNGSYFFRACEPAFLTQERKANSVAWREGKESLLTKEAILAKFSRRLALFDATFLSLLRQDEQIMQTVNLLLDKRKALIQDEN